MSPKGNTRLGSQPLVITLLSAIQYILLFYMCFCLKASYLYVLLIHNIELMASGTVTYA